MHGDNSSHTAQASKQPKLIHKVSSSRHTATLSNRRVNSGASIPVSTNQGHYYPSFVSIIIPETAK